MSTLCEMCNESASKYCCPRCNKYYCSLFCYRSEKHSGCSENFYRDCVMNHMNEKFDSKSCSKIMNILKCVKHNDNIEYDVSDNDNIIDSDEETYVDLTERLATCNLNNSDSIWNVLTNDERQEFEGLLHSGEIYKLIPTWQAWWEDESKIQEVTKDLMKYPSVKKDILDINMLTGQKPSPIVKYNIVNVLAAYVITVRYFYGEHQESCSDSVMYLISLSKNLDVNQNFNSIVEAISSAMFAHSDERLYDTVFSDVKKIVSLNSPQKNYGILCALSDLHNLLKKYMTNTRTKSKSNEDMTNIPKPCLSSNIDLTTRNIKLILKKIDYYLSYAGNCNFINEFENCKKQ